MLIVFTQDEVQRLIQNFSKKKIKVDFLVENQLTLKLSGVKLHLFLTEVRPKRVTFIYKMNSVVNFILDKFFDLDKPGILWDKEADTIGIDLNQFLKDERMSDFFLRQLLIDESKMILDFDLAESKE